MAIAPLPTPTLAGVVAGACDGLASLDGSLWSARRPEELVAGVEELQPLKARAAALEAELLAELDAQDTAERELAWGSTGGWFMGGDTDPRDHGARTWDAPIGLAQHALDTAAVPDSHGTRPTVVVTVDADTLTGHATTPGDLEDDSELSGSAVRHMACDADLIRVLLEPDGSVLDVGRRHRLVTPTIWTALVARDRHRAFPGCTRPPGMCHAHHIRHWTHGGNTSLDNTVLLCGHHHHTLHHTPWQVRLADHDARPEFLPPGKHGRPAPEWIRYRPRRS